jgi:hypothetical protein
MNAIAERWIGGCRRELLDRTLIWNQALLRRLLSDYETHHNRHRPHRSLRGAVPLKALPEPADQARPGRWADPRISAGRMTWTKFSAHTTLSAAVPLAAVFLLDPQRAAQMQREDLGPENVSPRCRYFLHLSVLHLEEKHGLFFWHNHLETLPEWDDALIIDVGPDLEGRGEYLWSAWQSENPKILRSHQSRIRSPLNRASPIPAPMARSRSRFLCRSRPEPARPPKRPQTLPPLSG